MVLPSFFLILVAFIGAQINAYTASVVKIPNGIRGTHQNNEHDDEFNESISRNHVKKSFFKKLTKSDATINDTDQPTSLYISNVNSNELNSFININVSMNIGGRSWSFHDTKSSVAPDKALKAMLSLLSKEDRDDLERDMRRGFFDIRRLMNDVNENTDEEKTTHVTVMSDSLEIMEDSEVEMNPIQKGESPLIVSNDMHRDDLERDMSRGIFDIRRLMNDVTKNTDEEKATHVTVMSDPSVKMEDFEIEIDHMQEGESPLIASNDMKNERRLKQCFGTQKSLQIHILVGSDTDGLSWALSKSSDDTELKNVTEQGGEQYTYDGSESWNVKNTCIEKSDCYTFSIIGEPQNTTNYYKYYKIIVDDKVYQSNVGYPGTEVKIGCNDDNNGEVTEYQPRICKLNPIISPLNGISQGSFDTRTDNILSIISGVSDKEAFTNPNSPEYKAACWIIYDDPRELSTTDISVIQRYILAVLYFSTNGESWNNKYNFLTEKDECDWNSANIISNELGALGVSCTNGLVSIINLSSNNLNGHLPPEVSKLLTLDSLNLRNNFLKSTIPSHIRIITNLTNLDISNNMMEGEISDLLNVVNLKVLNIANNRFTGSLSSSLGDLTNLTSLILSENLLNGAIPEEMYKLSMLHTLKVDKNSFSGTISTNIGQFFYLKRLDMSQNDFRGTIPSNIGNIPLELLSLGGNMLTGNIPNEITNLHNLKTLILRNNELVGTIPSTIYKMTSLTTIEMSNNAISGSLPLFPEKVQSMQFQNNHFESTIPVAIGNLTNLFKLRLDENQLTGNVPESVCQHFKNDPGSRYGDETIFTTDCAQDFLPPKVNCTCCTWCFGRFDNYDRVSSCPGGELRVDINYKVSNWYKMSWFVRDQAGETIFEVGPLVSVPRKSSYKACIPITGCFNYVNFNPTGYTHLDRTIFVDDRVLDNSNNTEAAFGYDSTTDSLSIDKCDEVMFNGETLTNQKRKIFNELAMSSGLSTLRDPSTPQYKAAEWTLNDADSKKQDRDYKQRYLLSLLYHSTKGDSWINSDGFLTDEHECNWYGITCDTKYINVVREINLSDNNLDGTLLSEIGELSALEYLNLSQNKNLTGNIPIEIGNLWSLRGLNLAYNTLNGTFPGTLGMMKYIKTIEMNDNILDGNLPALVDLTSLQTLNLANNYLNGAIKDHSLPTQSLAFLDLHSNLFSDQLPMSIVDALNLRELDLSVNYLTSTIPVLISNLQYLVKLQLDQNEISGTIPRSVSNMSKLTKLTLHSNSLTGTIPSELGELTQLMKLTVSYNSLKGGIPREIANLANLSLLHLQGNELTGDTAWMNDCGIWSTSRSFIADCGEPSAILPGMACPCCTECCNVEELCQTNDLQKFSPFSLTFICMGAICGFMVLVCTIAIKTIPEKHLVMRCVHLDVLKTCGEDSVYSLVFSKSTIAWIITLLTALFQVLLFSLFLLAASFGFGDSDWVYTMRCPENSLECNDEREISWYTWLIFGIYIFICLVKDAANGCKLVFKTITSGCYRCLVSGVTLILVSCLAAFTSYYYNNAIAMSNTEVIMNTAVLLFINDMDERVYEVLTTLFPNWMETQISEMNRKSDDIKQKSKMLLRRHSCKNISTRRISEGQHDTVERIETDSTSSFNLRQTLKDQDDTVKQLMNRIEILENRFSSHTFDVTDKCMGTKDGNFFIPEGVLH